MHRDKAGLEGLPLQLVIVAVVLGISLPIVYSAFDNYDRARVDSAARTEAERMLTLAVLLYAGGPGNSDVLTLEILSGVAGRVDFFAVGGEPGTLNASSIRYKLVGGIEQRVSSQNSNVQMTTESGGALYLGPGRSDVQMECLSRGGETVVEVRRL